MVMVVFTNVVQRFRRRSRARLDRRLRVRDAQVTEDGETQSRDAYAAHHLAEDIAFLKKSDVKLLSRASMTMGDGVQVASDSEITAVQRGKPIALRNHEAMQLKRIDGAWKIAAIRWESQRSGGAIVQSGKPK